MKSEQTRARIRVAAAKVIERDGAGHLTLEKVAAQADLSKGGLLYHYPSKDALLQGLLNHLLENRAGLIEGSGSAKGVSDATLLNSLIDADFDLPKDERIMAQGLIAASAATFSSVRCPAPSRSITLAAATRMRARVCSDFMPHHIYTVQTV